MLKCTAILLLMAAVAMSQNTSENGNGTRYVLDTFIESFLLPESLQASHNCAKNLHYFEKATLILSILFALTIFTNIGTFCFFKREEIKAGFRRLYARFAREDDRHQILQNDDDDHFGHRVQS